MQHNRRIGELLGERCFAAFDGDAVCAYAKLRHRDGVAQVEDVAVAPEHRGAGLGRLVTSAALAAGLALEPELLFIVADEEDWPQELYARLGFEPAGRIRGFLRPPPPDPRAATRPERRPRRPLARLRLGAPPAREVARVAQVAQERRVGDRARVPRPRRVGRDRGGEVGAPVRPARVELGELVGRERAAQAAAQLGLDPAHDELQRAALLGRRAGHPPLALAPLAQRRLEARRHRRGRLPTRAAAPLTGRGPARG